MKIVVPIESFPGEKRVAILPEQVKKLKKLGFDVEVEFGLGKSINVYTNEYEEAGAAVVKDKKLMLSEADAVLRVKSSDNKEISYLKRGCFHISFLDPFNQIENIDKMKKSGVVPISLEMIPRTTLFQKMDALSSQANISGYVSAILAANKIDKVIPMMTTPSGTISPARVFVVGAGVCGLQAIATMYRLGARVEAFDTRPAVEEQVKSIGAKFVKIKLGDTGETKQGYAKALTKEQLDKQREEMSKICERSDIVILTAQVFGKKSPIILTKDMIEKMKPGSVVIDAAIDGGGNCEISRANEEVYVNGVCLVGFLNLPVFAAKDASLMYGNNLYNLIEHIWDKEKNGFILDEKSDLKGCIL